MDHTTSSPQAHLDDGNYNIVASPHAPTESALARTVFHVRTRHFKRPTLLGWCLSSGAQAQITAQEPTTQPDTQICTCFGFFVVHSSSLPIAPLTSELSEAVYRLHQCLQGQLASDWQIAVVSIAAFLAELEDVDSRHRIVGFRTLARKRGEPVRQEPCNCLFNPQIHRNHDVICKYCAADQWSDA